jgi:hypothetical protein
MVPHALLMHSILILVTFVAVTTIVAIVSTLVLKMAFISLLIILIIRVSFIMMMVIPMIMFIIFRFVCAMTKETRNKLPETFSTFVY